jgi:hypothetical protein
MFFRYILKTGVQRVKGFGHEDQDLTILVNIFEIYLMRQYL